MVSLIVGVGEVGKALYEIFTAVYPKESVLTVDRHGSTGNLAQKIDIMHVCFGYNPNFVKQVKEYQKKYNPTYTVIHSTVPVGTSRKVKAVHSPIRGIHPNLKGGILTFIKYLAGPDASMVADYFRIANMRVYLFDDPETTEAGKLFDTEYYRACIEFAQRVKQYCKEKNLNYHEVYTLFNISYNEGYTALNRPEYVRPVLQPIMKEIGGHCVLPNKELIKMDERDEKS